MKNRLFRTLMLIMFVVFFLTFLLCIYFFEIDINKYYIPVIALLALFLVSIPISSNILAHHIIDSSLSPVSSFLEYITDILLKDNYDESKIDLELENEVLEYLVTYGHNSKDVKEALSRVKHSQALRKEFSANVTHELKSPLTSINGYAEMIASGMTTNDESQKFAKIINQQGNRLLKMIDETIQLSKFDSNYVKHESFDTFNVSETINYNINALAQFAVKKNVKINYEKEDIYYYGNEKLIEDIIRNLISNAIKYSKPTGGYVNIQAKEDMDELTLTVEDNGIGISEDDQERVFERFYVANKSRGSKTGTGLGLSLVKNIAQMHRGKVVLESALNEGSRFTVILPKLSEKDYE